jgi:hypothetical protein
MNQFNVELTDKLKAIMNIFYEAGDQMQTKSCKYSSAISHLDGKRNRRTIKDSFLV